MLTALHAGRTLADIAKSLGISRRTITTWIAKQSDDDHEALAQASRDGVAVMMEDTIAIADDLADEVRQFRKPVFDKNGKLLAELHPVAEIVAADKECIAVRQHYAERKDKETWGLKATTEVTITHNTLHLDALRRYHDPQYERPAVPLEVPAALLEPSQPTGPLSPAPTLMDLW